MAMAIEVLPMTEEHLDGVERLQHECYPTMEEHEKITAERAAHFLEVFREGQTVAVETSGSGRGRVVGMNSGFLVADFDFAKEGGHTFQEITGGLTYSNHSPDGEFYYGYGEGSPKPKLQPRVRLTLSLSLSLSLSFSLSGDICVSPAYRRRGVGRKLYESRKRIARELNLRGVVAGGMLTGLKAHREGPGAGCQAGEYVEKVCSGELVDPTLTFQLRCGFRVMGLLPGYIDDASCCSTAALIFWENPNRATAEERAMARATT